MNTLPTPHEQDIDLPHEVQLDLHHEVQRLLNLHRGQWGVISQACDVSYSWISKFARGKITNPGYATLKRLHALLWDRPVLPPPLNALPRSMRPPAPPVETETAA